MKIKELIEQLGDNFPINEDYNFESFLLNIEQEYSIAEMIKYGNGHGPIINKPGFTIIIKLKTALVINSITYGPKVKRYFLDNLSENEVII